MKTTLIFAALTLFGPSQVFAIDLAYKPLWLYQGTWTATKRSPLSESTTKQVVSNECAVAGRFFTCQQRVDGKIGSLIIFIPAASPGNYYTQAVLPEGWATGRGELHIEGERWTYSSKGTEDAKTTYYRTTNLFSGKDHIHFEQAESPDGQNWTVTASGDEVRTSKAHR